MVDEFDVKQAQAFFKIATAIVKPDSNRCAMGFLKQIKLSILILNLCCKLETRFKNVKLDTQNVKQTYY